MSCILLLLLSLSVVVGGWKAVRGRFCYDFEYCRVKYLQDYGCKYAWLLRIIHSYASTEPTSGLEIYQSRSTGCGEGRSPVR